MVLSSEQARAARRRARAEYPAQLRAFPEWRVLDALVKSPESSVADAVERLLGLAPAAPVTADTNNNNNNNEATAFGDHAYHTFLSLVELAKRTPPGRQAPLVECVARLQKHALADPATGEPLRHDGYLVWTQLPALGYVAADEWHSIGVYIYTRPATTNLPSLK